MGDNNGNYFSHFNWEFRSVVAETRPKLILKMAVNPLFMYVEKDVPFSKSFGNANADASYLKKKKV